MPNRPKQRPPLPPQDPPAQPAKDPPAKPLHDPPADPTREPAEPPIGEPAPGPGMDPPWELLAIRHNKQTEREFDRTWLQKRRRGGGVPCSADKNGVIMPQCNAKALGIERISYPRTLLWRLIATGVLLAAPSVTGAQESYRGSQAEQQACTDDVFRLCDQDDVFRLCDQFVPDEQRIIACLIKNRQNLSPACQAVFLREPQGGRQRPLDGGPRR